jgi:hypothetical protein
MILWYTAGAVFLVWNVFQSPGLDMRAVALGALLPLVLDAPFTEQAYAHTLLAPIAAMTVVMLATLGRGRRLARRRLLGVPIGWFCGLVLSGAWAHHEVFWWPLFGTDLPSVPLLPPVGIIVLEEALGALAAWWCYRRFGLADPRRREQLWRNGRVGVVAS